jgi:hypothetical protein
VHDFSGSHRQVASLDAASGFAPDHTEASVDETQKRLTAVETTQAETKIILQGLVTKTELSEFPSEVRIPLIILDENECGGLNERAGCGEAESRTSTMQS